MRDPQAHAKVLALRLETVERRMSDELQKELVSSRFKRLVRLFDLIDSASSANEAGSGWYYDSYSREWTRRTYTTIPDTEEEAS